MLRGRHRFLGASLAPWMLFLIPPPGIDQPNTTTPTGGRRGSRTKPSVHQTQNGIRGASDAVPAPCDYSAQPGLWGRISAPGTTPVPVLGTPWVTLLLWGEVWMGLFFVESTYRPTKYWTPCEYPPPPLKFRGMALLGVRSGSVRPAVLPAPGGAFTRHGMEPFCRGVLSQDTGIRRTPGGAGGWLAVPSSEPRLHSRVDGGNPTVDVYVFC